jgi:hypothetical protein
LKGLASADLMKQVTREAVTNRRGADFLGLPK